MTEVQYEERRACDLEIMGKEAGSPHKSRRRLDQ
jgi:hypothetical protein